MRYELIIEDGVDRNKPLIYKWEILGLNGNILGIYIGKATRGARRRIRRYVARVRQIRENKPYSKEDPNGFRKVHRALAKADALGHRIKLFLVCNAADESQLHSLERDHIASQNCKGEEPWQLNAQF